MSVEIRVKFPKNCLVRRGKSSGKSSFYRGIVMNNTEEFRAHYLNSETGEPIRQPETGETVYYTVQPPRNKRDAQGNILFDQYEDMILEPWSSADGRKGLSILEGRSEGSMIADQLANITRELGEDVASVVRNQMAATLASDIMSSIRNQKTSSTRTMTSDVQITPRVEGNQQPSPVNVVDPFGNQDESEE